MSDARTEHEDSMFHVEHAGAVVTALRPSARAPGKVSVIVGRKSAGVIDAAEADRLGVRVGAAWSEELARRVALAADAAKAHRYALNSLGAKAQSREGLLRKLRRRGHAEEACKAVVERLERAGLLDDAAFAREVARSVLARGPAGRVRIEQALRRRGIAADAARSAATEALEGRDVAEDARALAARRMRALPRGLDDRAKQRRVYAYLARRGFDADVCAAAVRATASDDSGR